MRREERKVNSMEEILNIISRCEVCHLALCGEKGPYVVPMNFGVEVWEDKLRLYFHGAGQGTKMSLLAGDNRAAFSMSCGHKVVLAQSGCEATMEYKSVCGSGRLVVVEGEEKVAGLTAIMNQYDEAEDYHLAPQAVEKVTVLRLEVEQVSGKASHK